MDGLWIQAEDYLLTRWIFLRLLGLVYLIAFVSFAVQAEGLIGRRGMLPVGEFLKAVQAALGAPRGYLYYPTLSWLNTSDAFLKGMCWVGAVLGLLLLLGVGTTPVLLLLWVLYLSLTTSGQIFMGYQWDALLLEAGFLSIFLVPPSLLPSQAAVPPAPLAVFLMRWLLFRLIFMSGLAKITSGDSAWRSLTALSYHYETQPIPNALAYWMHRLHLPFQKFSTLMALAVELLAPFLYFGPRPLRWVGLGFTLSLMLLVEATGNFAFFNLLTVVLAVFLLDDRMLEGLSWLKRFQPAVQPEISGAMGWWNLVLVPVAALSLLVGGAMVLSRMTGKAELLRPFRPILPVVSAFRLVNTYGLFAVMTTERPEIILEGSEDGSAWQAYEFRYKPGDLFRAPPVVAPHQPRLDWQMWFAALRGDYTREAWFMRLVEALLNNEPVVLRLLAYNPFPDRPPRYVRAVMYDYEFTTPAERAAGGAWWRREELGLYLPPVSLPANP
jgi:hypothetical protein